MAKLREIRREFVVVPSSNRLSRASGWHQVKLTLLCLAVLLPGSLLAAQAASRASESAPPAPAQQPAQPAPAQSAQPQSQPAPSQPAQPSSTRPVRRRPTLDDRVKAFAKSLDLNEAQQAAVKRILIQRQQEILRLRQDGSISGEERIGRLRALQDQTAERIRNVLNDEQKKKYNPLATRQLTPAPDQKSLEDWLKVTTPHQ